MYDPQQEFAKVLRHLERAQQGMDRLTDCATDGTNQSIDAYMNLQDAVRACKAWARCSGIDPSIQRPRMIDP
jgi:hypothetical protein